MLKSTGHFPVARFSKLLAEPRYFTLKSKTKRTRQKATCAGKDIAFNAPEIGVFKNYSTGNHMLKLSEVSQLKNTIFLENYIQFSRKTIYHLPNHALRRLREHR